MHPRQVCEPTLLDQAAYTPDLKGKIKFPQQSIIILNFLSQKNLISTAPMGSQRRILPRRKVRSQIKEGKDKTIWEGILKPKWKFSILATKIKLALFGSSHIHHCLFYKANKWLKWDRVYKWALKIIKNYYKCS